MFAKIIAKELDLKEKQVASTISLLDEGNTIPFIARYRKEVTGELDEVVLRKLEERVNYLRNLKQRKEEVLRLIEEQGKLTPELSEAITKAEKLQEVEDLYRPYRQKRRTRATVAKEKGLEPLAMLIVAEQEEQGNWEEIAAGYINSEQEVFTAEDAINYAKDIVAELVSDDARARNRVRELIWSKGLLASAIIADEKGTYQIYHNYQEPVAKIPPHRILALNRGEKEEALQVKVTAPMEEITLALEKLLIKNPAGIFTKHYREAIADSLKRLIYPSLEREIRSELTAKGEEQAISVFSKNLRQLLLQPPVKGKMVLGIDPGYRTGCKLAVVDETGKLLTTGTIYPHPPQNQREQAKNTIHSLVQQYGADLIAVGNGTASRETEALAAELIGEQKLPVQYIIVSEAGASVYSASPLAREEFPESDVSLRSAVSIARRLQDPLAELVKIEPKAVGVGQYQHDVTPKRLEESLGGVVEDCVNQVGVDLNTASASLLSYVAGLSMTVAKKIVAFREEKGKFRTRTDLLKVPRLGEKTFVQCAGFLRLPEGDNYLENTPVHPESYELAQGVLKLGNCAMVDLRENLLKVREELNKLIPEQVATRLEAGLPTVRDIINALVKPGRDPRDELPKPLLRSDITTIENLTVGMALWGTVRNVVDFGAFVDIGLKQDGLVHISQLADKYVKHPMEVVSVGDIVKVRITNIDKARERIGLSMREEVV
jgi:uncharacterized protein